MSSGAITLALEALSTIADDYLKDSNMEKLMGAMTLSTTTKKACKQIMKALGITSDEEFYKGFMLTASPQFTKTSTSTTRSGASKTESSKTKVDLTAVFAVACIVSYINEYHSTDPGDVWSSPAETTSAYDLYRAGSRLFSGTSSRNSDKPNFTKLPSFSGDPLEWFEWKFEAMNMITGAGYYGVIESKSYALHHPVSSEVTYAMIIDAVSGGTKSFALAQFIALDNGARCGFDVWQKLLKLYENGPVIKTHMADITHKLTRLECKEGLMNLMKFAQEFFALKQQALLLRDVAKAHNSPNTYEGIQWRIMFLDKLSKVSAYMVQVDKGRGASSTTEIWDIFTTIYGEAYNGVHNDKRKGTRNSTTLDNADPDHTQLSGAQKAQVMTAIANFVQLNSDEQKKMLEDVGTKSGDSGKGKGKRKKQGGGNSKQKKARRNKALEAASKAANTTLDKLFGGETKTGSK